MLLSVVTTTADVIDPNDGVLSLREAVINANANAGPDEIVLGAGVYTFELGGSGEDAGATGDLDVTDTGGALTIRGDDQVPTIIDAGDFDRVFELFPGVSLTLIDVTIRNGSASSGGLIRNNGGQLDLQRVTLADGDATGNGGAIESVDGTLTATEVVVSGSTGTFGGGLFLNGTVTSLQNAFVLGNEGAANGGGMLILGGQTTIDGSTFQDNIATGSGGGINHSTGSTLTITNTALLNNIATNGSGGAIYGSNTNSTLVADALTVSGNTAGTTGGGVHLQTTSATFMQSEFSNNTADGDGGGLWANGTTLSIAHSSIIGNEATTGGGLHVSSIGSTVDLTNVTVSNNTAINEGGGLRADDATLNIVDSTISGNDGLFGGGVFLNGAVADLLRVSVLANHGGGNGGGMLILGGQTTIGDSHFNDNVASASAGALMNSSGSTLHITATEFLNNHANLGDAGAILTQGASSTLTGELLTVSGNSADDNGGGIKIQTSTATFTGLTLTNNTAGGDGGGLRANGSTVSVADSSITDNTATDGGGLHLSSIGTTADLTNVTIGGNTATSEGGGLRADDVTLTTVDTVFSDNTAVFGGGLFLNGAVSDLQNAFVLSNLANAHGGGMLILGGQTTISDTHIQSNTAAGSGGGINHSTGSTLTITNSALLNNIADLGSGGAIYGSNANSTLVADALTVSGNTAGTTGGGVHLQTTSATFMQSEFSNNTADGDGGGLWANGTTLSISDSSITENSAVDGGGLHLSSIGAQADLTNVTVDGNTAGEDGGGIGVFDAALNINSSVLSNNTAFRGGGLFNDQSPNSVADVVDTTIVGNSAFGGAGLLNAGVMSVFSSTIAGNTATGFGGGINQGDGALDVNNSTLSGNLSGASGGGIHHGSGDSTILNSTITANSAGTAGGVNVTNPTMNVGNTIIAANFDNVSPNDADVNGPFNSLGHNLIGQINNATGFVHGVNGDIVGTVASPIDPRLRPLADNGGPTLTHALLFDSPAVDGGDDVLAAALTADQRGEDRVVDGDLNGPAVVDIGAFELVDAPPQADAGGPYHIVEGDGLTLDASASFDPAGDPISVAWDLNGDGQYDDGAGAVVHLTSAQLVDMGWYGEPLRIVSVRVEDPAGLATTDDADVFIDNLPPVVDALNAPATANEGDLVTVIASAFDPGFDPLSYQWTVLRDGSPVNVPLTSDRVLTFTPEDEGVYEVQVTAIDSQGAASAPLAQTIHVANVAPAIHVDRTTATITDQGGSALFSVMGTIADPGNDAVSGTVSYGDGTVEPLVIDGQGGFTLLHGYTYTNESHAFRIVIDVSDGDGGSDQHVGSQAIVTGTLGDDTINVAVGSVVITANGVEVGHFADLTDVFVLGGPGNDSIAAEQAVELPLTIDGGDGDDTLQGGGGANVIIGGAGNDAITGGGGSNVLLGGDGDDVITGGAGSNTVIGGGGSNTFVDGGGSNTVEPTPGSTTPEVFADAFATNEDAPLVVNTAGGVLANDIDPQGQPLTASVLSDVQHGELQLNGDGSFTYTPAPGFSGIDSFTYEATNGEESSGPATVQIKVRNLVDLAGRVFDDLNHDGIQDPGEDGVEGVTIELFDQVTGALLGNQMTDAAGDFAFDANLAAGTYRLVQTQPGTLLDGDETVGSIGGSIDNTQDSNVIGEIIVGAPGTTADGVGYLFADIQPSDLSGLVWEDFNNDGEVNFGEKAIEGVQLALTGTDDRGQAVNRGAMSDADGIFMFPDLRPGEYTLTETQPASHDDGLDVVGTVNDAATGSNAGNDVIAGIVLPAPGSVAENYNFGERPTEDGVISAGQTAAIGFWQNNNGQSLIRELNGGEQSTQLGDWLAATLPNMYGALAGMSNADVADFYSDLFRRKKKEAMQLGLGGPVKVDAQVLATALAVYVTNQTLAGTLAEAYGFLVTDTGVGTRLFNVGDNGDAFGWANGSDVQVLDLLFAVDARSINGVLYDLDGDGDADDELETLFRTMANDVFSAINEAGNL